MLAACSGAPAPARRQAAVTIPRPPPTLAAAVAHAVHLGPSGPETMVHLSFGLKARNPDQLDAVIRSGRPIPPAEYTARFGPDPTLVAPAVATIESAGLAASWPPGSGVIAADGPAPRASALLDVDFESYRIGTYVFYAATDRPHLPAPLAAVASGVSGLDDYRRARGLAIRPGGLTPVDVLTYYDIKPLRDAGFDGTGETILLPEIDDVPNLSDLDHFASEFGLPPFEPILTIKRDPAWGTPEKPQGEAVLDLEVAHAVAPNARLIVYMSASDFAHGDRAFDQMVTDHLGSIISESLGSCEPDTPDGARSTYQSIQDRAVALGIAHFVASGDNGAFTCGLDQDPAASFPSTLPTVTAVGGTTVFESKQGLYFREFAWGSPLDQAGGGGGSSQFYALPEYQRAEAQASGQGQRQVPDVAADADPSSGYHIYFDGQDGQAGGTSAATPLWASTVALIEQDMRHRGLRGVGFANPALYWIGENSNSFNPRPFHDVTAGNNLGFDATAGWDFATGWGSMDAAALDSAWVQYVKAGGK